MRKVIRPGTLPTHGGGRVSLFCRVTDDDGYLSFTGVIGPTQSGNAYGGCGQVDMDFAHRDPSHNDARYSDESLTQPSDFNFAPGWDADLWLDFLEAWKLWRNTRNLSEVPSTVWELIESLPDADRTPAWV